MHLKRLLDALPEARATGDVETQIEAIAYDSREVRPGSLFVSLPSVTNPDQPLDRYVPEAIDAGARAVVTQGDFSSAEVPIVRVSDAQLALADLAAAFFDYPSRHLQLFAATGTDGKTTTTFLLEQILAGAGFHTGLLGTVGAKIGANRLPNPSRMTTPQASEVQRMLRAMVDEGVTHAVLEASSHALALHRLRGCTFAACAVTNITADHVEFHGSWEAYFQAKASLFSELAPSRPAVLNRDDAQYDRLRSIISGSVTTYGFHPSADVRASAIEVLPTGTRCRVEFEGELVEMLVPMAGRFNVSNALAAAGLALTAGVPLRRIADAIARAQPPPGRLQRIDAGQPFEVIVDYAHTVNGFRSVLAALREHLAPGRRLITVFGAAGDRDKDKRPELGGLAHQYADFFVITNEDPFGEDPDAIMAQIASGVPQTAGARRFAVEPDRGRAIELAFSHASPGDTVAILGKGHEQSIAVQGTQQPWSDVEVARSMLAGAR